VSQDIKSVGTAGRAGAVCVLLEGVSSSAEPGLEHIDLAGETVRSWKSSSMGMYGANISRYKPTPYNNHNHQHIKTHTLVSQTKPKPSPGQKCMFELF